MNIDNDSMEINKIVWTLYQNTFFYMKVFRGALRDF